MCYGWSALSVSFQCVCVWSALKCFCPVCLFYDWSVLKCVCASVGQCWSVFVQCVRGPGRRLPVSVVPGSESTVHQFPLHCAVITRRTLRQCAHCSTGQCVCVKARVCVWRWQCVCEDVSVCVCVCEGESVCVCVCEGESMWWWKCVCVCTSKCVCVLCVCVQSEFETESDDYRYINIKYVCVYIYACICLTFVYMCHMWELLQHIQICMECYSGVAARSKPGSVYVRLPCVYCAIQALGSKGRGLGHPRLQAALQGQLPWQQRS